MKPNRTNSKHTATIGLLLSLASGAIVQAATITTGVGQGADAYIELGSDTGDNFGSLTELRVRSHPDFPSDSGNLVRKSWVRFDTTTVNETPGAGNAAHVAFVLTWRESFEGGATGLPWTMNLYGLKDTSLGVAGDNGPSAGTPGWGEATITGSTAPGNDIGFDGDNGGTATSGVTVDATILASFTLTSTANANDTLLFSSAALTDFVLADTNDLLTFILVAENDTTGNGATNGSIAKFHSKEGDGSRAPSLTIVPEPSAMALLALSAFGLIARRRRVS